MLLEKRATAAVALFIFFVNSFHKITGEITGD